MTVPDTYDTPWKDILEGYLPEFMAFFFPDIDTAINWSRGYAFLDKELQSVTRDAEIGLRLADKLVQVWRKDGTDAWVLIHRCVPSGAETHPLQRWEERSASARFSARLHRRSDCGRLVL